MKIIFLGLGCVSLVLGLAVAVAQNNLKVDKLDPLKATQMWGKSEFTVEKFRSANVEQRAAMAAEIVSQKKFVGSTVKDVISALGPHDAYFRNDFVPAYALTEGWKSGGDTWQLVFLPNADMKIVDVFINKNCCSK
jgi:hypothetical protein